MQCRATYPIASFALLDGTSAVHSEREVEFEWRSSSHIHSLLFARRTCSVAVGVDWNLEYQEIRAASFTGECLGGCTGTGLQLVRSDTPLRAVFGN